MSREIWSNGTLDTLAGSNRYLALKGASEWSGSRGTVPKTIISAAGIISDLRVVLLTAPGSGTTRRFTVYKNGASTSVVVTIADTTTSGADTSNTISVSAGDYVQLYAEETVGSPAATYLKFTVDWTPTTNGEHILAGCIEATNISNTDDISLAGSANATGGEYRIPMPSGGTITDLQVRLSAANVGIGSRTFTLYKNGVATALTCTINSGNTGSDTSNSVSVSDGDTIHLHCTKSSIVNATKVAASVTTLLDDPDDFLIASTSSELLPRGGGADEQLQFCTGDGVDGSGGTYNQLMGQCRIKRIRAQVFLAPSGTPTAGGPPKQGQWSFFMEDFSFGQEVILDHDSVQKGRSVLNRPYLMDSQHYLKTAEEDVVDETANHCYCAVTFLATVLPDQQAVLFGANF